MASATACVAGGDTGNDFPQQCTVDSDCDSANGEICDEGICWGDPPDTTFAGVLRPTGEQAASLGLVTTELPDLEISTDGTIDDLQFVEPVEVDAKVTVFCSSLADGDIIPCGADAPIAASIRVERDSAFDGGPRFVQTFTTDPTADPSVRMLLPPTTEDRPYTVIITPLPPDEENAAAPNYAEIAPQVKLPPLFVTSDTEIDWRIGDPDTHHFVSGCLKSGAGVNAAFQGMTAAATTFDPDTGTEIRISTVDRTDANGCFSIRVRDDLTEFNVVLSPKAGEPDPAIRIDAEPLGALSPTPCYAGGPSDSHCMGDILGPDLATAVTASVPIKSTDPAGGATNVGGASVRFFADVPLQDTRGGRAAASIEVITTSSASGDTVGLATARLRPTLTYEVSVIPGPESEEVAAIFGEPIQIQNGGVQAEIRLKRRIAVTGRLIDAHGQPIALAPIAAEPTIGFRLAQNADNRPLVQSLTASDVTTENGDFLLWLDGPLDLGPAGAGDPVIYNLVVTPPLKSAAPRWRFENVVATETEAGSMELGELRLPDGSFARGLVTAHDGTPVSGVSLHIYEPSVTDPCAGQVPASECPATAREVGNWLSDGDSIVRVVLPDP